MKNYTQTIKNVVRKVIPYIVAGTMALTAKAGDELSSKISSPIREASNYENVQKYLDSKPPVIELADARATAKSKLSLDARATEDGSNYVGLRYSTGLKELGNGMLMLVTPYRTNPKTGKTEILPAYSHMLREGGLLSPEYGALVCAPVNLIGKLCGKDEVLANPWYYNPALTGGVALDQLLLAAAAGGSGGSSEAAPVTVQPNQPSNNNNNNSSAPVEKPKPTTEQPDAPVVITPPQTQGGN